PTRLVPQQVASVGVWIGAHPPFAAGRESSQVWHEPALRIEELVGAVAAHPLLEDAQMTGLVEIRDRDLVGTERALDRKPVDDLGTRPALRRAEDDHRPARSLLIAELPRIVLNGRDLVEGLIERRRHCLVDPLRLVARDKDRRVAVALE